NPEDGFQRMLDKKRAQEIADYIDMGFGTIPCSIVLSAQPEAELKYISRTQVLKFKRNPRAFLILDGQHRVYGFRLAKSKLRVPVVIYNGLAKADEVRLFVDINTKQRPVPNELLLDIKRMAETETDLEALMSDIFDLFNSDNKSPLLGLMSPSERRREKISRVTFNAALKPILHIFEESDATYIYQVLSSYIHAWLPALRQHQAMKNITNSTLFRAMILFFPAVADRCANRYQGEYNVNNFSDVLQPFFAKIKKAELQKPGTSLTALHESFKRTLQSTFHIGVRRNTYSVSNG
ncbi:MAG: DGQHR domain-containing protein, partial [Nitrososphaera sp.]|nr:DGQHR domain-containing protein [Nitrososphaera sp.]